MKPLDSTARHVTRDPSRLIDLTLAVIAGVATVTLNAFAFWLSYAHLHDIAHVNGLPDTARSWAWPGTIDLFIILGETLIIRAKMHGTTDRFAYVLTSVGSTGSVALNVMGVGDGATRMQCIVAATPSVAALIGFAAAMRQLSGYLHPRDVTATPPPAMAAVTAAVTCPPPATLQPGMRDMTSQPPPAMPTVPKPATRASVPAERVTRASVTVARVTGTADSAPADTTGDTATRDDTPNGDIGHLGRAVDDALRDVTHAADGTPLLTAAEVAALKGVKPANVATWKHRDKIAPDPANPQMFHPADVAVAPTAPNSALEMQRRRIDNSSAAQ